MDGWTNGTVEQIGTASNCQGTTPTYFAWYEFYEPPGIPRVVISTVPVKPGDIIEAAVYYVPAWYFVVTIKDWTTGKSFEQAFASQNQQRTSVEWIAERPCCLTNTDNIPENLADFHQANFGYDKNGVGGPNLAVNNSTSGPISEFGNNVLQVTMESNGVIAATPTALRNPDSSFTVNWENEY